MIPDQYIPLDGNDFFQAVEGYGDEIAGKYMRVLWHYWHNMHCEGLLNDDEFLMNLARCDADKWPRVKQILFTQQKLFVFEGGLWHQKRARSEWHRLSDMMERNQERTQAATRARWNKLKPPARKK